MRTSSFALGLFAASATLALAAGAHAQQAAQPAEVGELVVTAQLREQRAVEVPFALTAYSGKDMADLGIQSFDQLSAFVPGFEVQNQSPNNPGFVMRGITSDSGEATNEPRVSVFQDGVSISKSRGSYVELFDIERVEIAKGPQSTLYGRGALIGGVNVIENKAQLGVFSVAGAAEGGNGGYWMAEGAVNAPIGDTAALRVAARFKQRDGYVENLSGGDDFDSVDTRAVRASLNWSPTSHARIDIIGNYQQDRPNGTSFKSLSYRPTDPVTGQVLGTSAPWNGAYLTGASRLENGKALGLNREVWGVTGLGRFELSPSLTLNTVTAFRQFDSTEIFDADGISLPVLTAAENAHGDQWSQEFRLNFAPEGRFSGFVGVDLFREKGYQRVPSQFDERVLLARLAGVLNGGPLQPGRPATDPAPAAVFNQTAFTAALLQGVAAASGVALSPAVAQGIAANLKSDHLETTTNGSKTNAIDLFADGTFHATEKLEFSAGVRYSHDDKTSDFRASVLNGRSILGGFIGALGQPAATRATLLGALAVPGAANIPTSAAFPVPLFGLGSQPTANNGDLNSAALKDNGLTWRATARYSVSDETSLYANYARGRRPEVLSASPPSAPGGPAGFADLDAETVDSFELGAKSEHLAGGRLSLEGAIFHYDYQNFQTTEQVGTTFVTTNAGEAKAYGFEGQARWIASDNLDLFATYAYNHSRFEAGIRKGDHFRLSPDHSASFAADFHMPVAGGVFSVRPSYTWQSKVWFDDDNDLPALQQPPRTLVADNIQDEVQKSYGLANLRVEFRPAGGNWSIGAFASNLFDKKYLKDAGNTGDSVGLPTFIAGEPRFYGLTLTFRQ
jgi:iron complex outermembrane receptor protein